MLNMSKATTENTQIDYHQLFRLLPECYIAFNADDPHFTFIDMSDSCLAMTGRKRVDIVGKPFFEVFPDVSEQYKKTGVSELAESFKKVIRSKETQTLKSLRYDIAGPDGELRPHYWRLTQMPILDGRGKVCSIVQSSLDITEHVEAQRKNRQIQEQLDEALSIGLVGTWAYDIALGKVMFDKNLAHLFGVKEKVAAKGLPIESFIDVIHPEDRPRVMDSIASTLKSGGKFEEEYRARSLKGQEYWVLARGKIEKDQGVIRFPGLIVDITRRKRAELAVIESESKLKYVAEALPQKIFMTEPDGTSSYMNSQWAEYTGLDLTRLKKMDWGDIVHPEDVERARETWAASLKNGTSFEVEQRFRNAEGAYRWHLTRARPMRGADGKVTRWIGSSTDISDQKQLELNLAFLAQASKILTASLNYEKTFKQIAELMVPKIADWCVIDLYEGDNKWNEVALAHKDPAKISLAHKMREMKPPDISLPAGVPHVVRTGEREYFPYITDQMIMAAVKDKKWLALVRQVGFHSMIIVPIIVDKTPCGALTIVSAEQKRQFTQSDLEMAEELAVHLAQCINNARHYTSLQQELKKREALEAELLQTNEQLEQRVQERTLQLKDMNRELQRSNKELQDFAYIASHDLQEPLRKIQAFSSLLLADFAKKLGDGSDYLERMNNAASRMSMLIEDLLAFSRVSTKARPFVKVDVGRIAREVVNDLEVRVERTNGNVHIGRLPVIEADPVQIRQLLQNLISNGLKFHVENRPPVIRIDAKRQSVNGNEAWEITVADNGIGFDEKYADKIFAVFQRLHSRGEYEGTGIGLAVCRKIIQRHNGTISVKSILGEGSVFTVILPAQQEPQV